MTCHDARELFSALLDDALPASERAALDAHLAGCAECRRELERFRGTVALLRAVEPARAPAGFVDRVLAAARPAPWYRRLAWAVLLPWRVKLPLEAAAILLVGVAVALVWRATPDLEQTARGGPAPAVSEPKAPALDAPRPTAALPPAPVRAEPPRVAAEPPPAAEPRARQKTGGVETLGYGERRSAPRDAREGVARREAAEEALAPALKSRVAPAPAAPLAKEGARADLGRGSVGLTVSDVAGRLVVADTEAAMRGLAALVTEVGGTTRARLDGADGPVLELLIPRARWGDFTRGLARLGAWTPEREPGGLPAEVRVALRVALR